MTERQNWLDNVRWQVHFYNRSPKHDRTDPEFDWAWLVEWQLGRSSSPAKMLVKRALSKLPVHSRWNPRTEYSIEWIEKSAQLLWGARSLLEDELSKVLFDMQLVLRATSHNQYYYPRIDFEDFGTVLAEKEFTHPELPTDYLGMPLRRFSLQLNSVRPACSIDVISTALQIRLLNSFRQYFIQRGSFSSAPSTGGVVVDCGACIGEISLIFAALVGPEGQVHCFDPVPLHSRFCNLQAELNPALRHVLHVNTLAVGETTREVDGARTDSDAIAPGGLSVDSFSMTALDDYVAKKKLHRIDLIKMDIEGSEKQALAGAANLIREFRPRLTISAYHLSDDLWEIPSRIKALNPRYKLYFGHHSPVHLESVYYASEDTR